MNKENIKTGIKELLDYYEPVDGECYEYTDNGIEKILSTWEKNKGEIIRAFERHPNYNGQGQIVLTEKFNREIDMDACCAELRILEHASYRDHLALSCLLERLQNKLAENPTNKVTEAMVVDSKMLYPEDKAKWFHEGQKLSKTIRKVCTLEGLDKELADFEKIYARLADSLSPITIERPFILSVNPIDYLTMSFGLNWASCHTIDKTDLRSSSNSYEGCYSSGTLSYMLDGSSIVMYTLSRDADLEHPEKNDKVQRQMLHWSIEGNLGVFGRLYPTSEDSSYYKDFREIAEKVLSEIFDLTNLWKTESGSEMCRENTESEGTHYRDYISYEVGRVLRHQSKTVPGIRVIIGHAPICPSCGQTHYEHEYITCRNCTPDNDVSYCYSCDAVIREDEGIMANDGTIFCCDECANNAGYYWACDSEEYHLYDSLTYDSYEDRYYWYESCVVAVEGNTYISEENAEADGYIEDCFGEWFYDRNDYYVVDGRIYQTEDDAINDGAEKDAYTGELFFPDSNTNYIGDLAFQNRANLEAYEEEVA